MPFYRFPVHNSPHVTQEKLKVDQVNVRQVWVDIGNKPYF